MPTGSPLRLLIVDEKKGRAERLASWLPAGLRPVRAATVGAALGILARDPRGTYAGVLLTVGPRRRSYAGGRLRATHLELARALVEHLPEGAPILVHATNRWDLGEVLVLLEGNGFAVTQVDAALLDQAVVGEWARGVLADAAADDAADDDDEEDDEEDKAPLDYRFGGAEALHFCATLDDDGVSAALYARGERVWGFNVAVRGRVGADVFGRSGLRVWGTFLKDHRVEWLQEPGLHDGIAEALSLLDPEWNTRGENFSEAVRRDAELQTLVESCKRLQHHLWQRSLHAARRTAMGFPASGSRWDVYTLLAKDEGGGRLGQLAATCPGLLLLLSQLGEPTRGQLIAQVQAGASVSSTLDAALASWSVEQTHYRRGQLLLPAAQRQWIRKAGRWVPPELLAKPRYTPLVPEDVPEADDENRTWYAAQHAAESRALERLEGAQLSGFLGFVSRHAVELARLGTAFRASLTIEDVVSDLADFVAGSGRHPVRATSPARLFEEARRWHTEQPHSESAFMADGPLDPGVFAGLDVWEAPGATVRRVATLQSLHDEGTQMGHCIATYAPLGARGQCQIFHAKVSSEDATVEIHWEPAGAKVVLAQARGPENGTISAIVAAVLDQWATELGEVVRAGPTPRPTGRFRAAEEAAD